MATKFTEYRGFHISASYYQAADGLTPTVMVSKHRSGGVTERQLTPPGRGFETEEEVFAAGIDYAKAAIDGRVADVDVSGL
jgi:hypothetical protein